MQLRNVTCLSLRRPTCVLPCVDRSARPHRCARSVVQRTQNVDTVTGVLFEPLSAIKAELATLDRTSDPSASFARSNFHPECEAALNEQINIDYNMSYVYHALWAYFDRDNVALPGLANFFKSGSDDERSTAELLMQYQNRRGGRVQLKNIHMPDVDISNSDKGDALLAMELSLSLEKLNFQKLRELDAVAEKHEDAEMSHFIEDTLLGEQAEFVKKVSEYVAQLRRVGQGLGVYQFDQVLANA